MKQRIGVLYGGQSEEHEVSVRSAKAVMDHLDPDRFEVVPLKVEKGGDWHHAGQVIFSEDQLDVVFPVLHGPFGEDGTVQGMLKLAGIPFVGPDHLSSAMCMDKGIMKDRLLGAGIPTPNYRCFSASETIDKKEILESFSFPIFVKPACLGSSVGISKVKGEGELLPAIEEAFMHDERIVIEQGIQGREIELSVLGNLEPEASLPGEVIPTHEFYSYEAKYLDEEGAHFELPARLPQETIVEIQKMGIEAFKVMRCEGMARVDFFLDTEGNLFLNELNTIPGFTSISLYPKLWEVSGLSYQDLLTSLIDLAVDRAKRSEGIAEPAHSKK